MSDAAAESPPEPTLRRVCAELIALRERNDRQHRLFEQTLKHVQERGSSESSREAAVGEVADQRDGRERL